VGATKTSHQNPFRESLRPVAVHVTPGLGFRILRGADAVSLFIAAGISIRGARNELTDTEKGQATFPGGQLPGLHNWPIERQLTKDWPLPLTKLPNTGGQSANRSAPFAGLPV